MFSEISPDDESVAEPKNFESILSGKSIKMPEAVATSAMYFAVSVFIPEEIAPMTFIIRKESEVIITPFSETNPHTIADTVSIAEMLTKSSEKSINEAIESAETTKAPDERNLLAKERIAKAEKILPILRKETETEQSDEMIKI
jgi:hypothetical protein